MIFKYKNTNKEIITQQQALQLDEYYKGFYDNNILIKEETYLDGDLQIVTHHNINNDSHQTILGNHYGSSDSEFCIVDHIVYSNGYRLEKMSSYSDANGTLVGRTNDLYDVEDEFVGHEMFLDSETTPQYSSTLKYYYDRNINSFNHLFEVKYDHDTGDFLYFTFNQEHTDPFGQDSFALENTPTDIQKLIDITGMSQELIDYYLVSAVEPTW